MPTIKDYYLPKRPTLLFSLHPEPTQAIINGTKILEYRRRFFARPFQAFVYTTGDNGGIQLFLRCDQGLQLVPEQLALVGALLQHDAPTRLILKALKPDWRYRLRLLQPYLTFRWHSYVVSLKTLLRRGVMSS